MDLVDENGNVLKTSLLGGSNVTFDTVTNVDGTVDYIVRSDVVIKSAPAFLIIRADQGTFDIDVSMKGIAGTWMDDYGLRVFLGDYSADLSKSNGYSSPFMNGTEKASFAANIMYPVSFQALDGKGTSVIPESIKGISIDFIWTTSAESHVVVIIVDEEATVFPVHGSFVVPEPPQKEGYSFVNWVDQDGKIHYPGEIIEMKSDLALLAQWTPNLPISSIVMSVAAAVITAVVLAAGYRYGVSRVQL